MSYVAILAFLQRAFNITVGFIRDNWKWLSFFVLAAVLYLYVHSIKAQRDDLEARYQEALTTHEQYVAAQKGKLEEREAQVKSLEARLKDFNKELDREIEARNEVIDRITDSNTSLVDRLRQQTTETNIRYQQVPYTDPAILRELEARGEKLAECSGRYSEVARVADQHAIDLNAIGVAVAEYNREVEEFNKGTNEVAEKENK